jgi:hypothetical protein
MAVMVAHRPGPEIIFPVNAGIAAPGWENGAVERANDPLPITVATKDGARLPV